MPALLHITVRPRGQIIRYHASSAVAAHEWKEHNPGGRVVERDLARTSLSFVDSEWTAGMPSLRPRRTAKATNGRSRFPMS